MKRFILTILAIFLLTPVSFTQSPFTFPVSTIPGLVDELRSIPDGQGRTIAVWEEHRDGRHQIIAQRYDRHGLRQWQATGVIVWDTSETYIGESWHSIADDGAGGAFVGITACFYASGMYRYEWFLQHIDSSGSIRFNPRGVSVGGDRADLRQNAYLYPRPGVASDGAGGAYISWCQWRSDSTVQDLNVQKVNQAGVVQWDSGGNHLPTIAKEEFFTISVTDGSGGVIVVVDGWDADYGFVQRAVRFDSLGVPQWPGEWRMLDSDAARMVSLITQFNVISDGSGGAFVAEASGDPSGWGMHVIHISHGGDILWNTPCDTLPITNFVPWAPEIFLAQGGGVYVGWGKVTDSDQRNMVQRLTSAGEPKWKSGGIEVGSHTFYYGSNPGIGPDGYGGVIATWSMGDTISVQQVDSNGAHLLDPGGVKFTGRGEMSEFTSNGKGEGFVFYRQQGFMGLSIANIPFYPGIFSTWRLKSVPSVVEDAALTTLFPTSISHAYRFSTYAYLHEDTLQNGYGYWIKTPGDVDADVLTNSGGTPLLAETLDVAAGWHTIGSLGEPVPASSLTSDPPGLIASEVYGFHGGYFLADTITPGEGYWIRLQSPGKLIFSSSPAAEKAGSMLNHRDAWAVLTITDARMRSQKLFFGPWSGEDLSRFEMPPQPPDGSFDIRYSSGRIFESHPRTGEKSCEINLSNVQYPITVSWNAGPSMAGARLRFGAGEVDIDAQGREGGMNSVVIQHPGNMELVLGNPRVTDVPASYSLGQNYPNPFNPVTLITYSLPNKSHVSLMVLNVLGQVVEVLINQEEEAGNKSIEWNAEKFPSGIYFYRLYADGFSATRKLTLIK